MDSEIKALIEAYVTVFTRYRNKAVKVTYSKGLFLIMPNGLQVDRATFIRYTDNLKTWEQE